MERNQTLESNWRGGLESKEPHFDDERTILSAQPVVPLNAVANEQSRRRWMLVGAFVIASLLGSAVALALVRFRQPVPVNTVATESEALEKPTEEPVAQVPETEVSEPETLSDPSAGEPKLDVSEPAPRVAKPRRPVQATSRQSAPRQVTITVNTNPPSDEGQARLVDQWQERRQRRVNRKPQNNHSSDLFRIREIFEGPRRNRRLNN